MSIAEKLNVIAENEQKVYDAGYSQSESDFYDIIQDGGNRTDYRHGFMGWQSEFLRPKHKVVATGDKRYMFAYNKQLKIVEKDYFDLSKCDRSWGNSYVFDGCESLEEVQDIGLQATGYYGTYRGCKNLRIIETHRTGSYGDPYTLTFYGCESLEEIRNIEGEISKNGFDISASNKVTHDTLMRIINALKDYSTSGTTYNITFGTDNLAKLSDTEKAIATQKGWTLA